MRPITDLILRMQPYPDELKEICVKNPDLAVALKNTYPKRFISLGAVVVTHYSNDEVIGFYVYDYGSKPEMFKQDFIVNVRSKYKDFIIYTRFSGILKSKYIRDISHFYEKYPTYPKSSHHPSYEEIPDVIKPSALEAIKLARRIKKLGLRQEISEEEYLKFDSYLREHNL